MSTTTPRTPDAASGRAVGRTFQLLQLGDGLFPVGAFSFSQSLEAFVQDGAVRGGGDFGRFLRDLLTQIAWTDGIALLHAFDAMGRGDGAVLVAVESELMARKLGRESRAMALTTGRTLWRAAQALWPETLGPAGELVARGSLAPVHAVALAVVARAAGLDRAETFALQSYGAASGVCGAALRLLRVDHIEVQRWLQRAQVWSGRLYANCAAAGLEEMRGFSPALEIEGLRHEEAFVRLFSS